MLARSASFVHGGGNSAGEESLFLTRLVDRMTMLVRGLQLNASKMVVDALAATECANHHPTPWEPQGEGQRRLRALVRLRDDLGRVWTRT